jgi:hypothetical protein
MSSGLCSFVNIFQNCIPERSRVLFVTEWMHPCLGGKDMQRKIASSPNPMVLGHRVFVGSINWWRGGDFVRVTVGGEEF